MRLLMPAFVVTTLGCTYHRSVPPSTNGLDQSLFLTSADGYAMVAGAIPIGFTRDLAVSRTPGGTIDCHPLGIGAKSLSPQTVEIRGGGHPDLPPDKCSVIGADRVTLESAECADASCEITTDVQDRQVILHVTSKTAATTELHVTLRSLDDGKSYADRWPIRFAAPKRVQLSAEEAWVVAYLGPNVVGTHFRLPWGTVVDDAEQPMNLPPGALERRIEDDSLFRRSDYSFDELVAQKPGRTKVRWQLGDIITRDLEVEIVGADSLTDVVVTRREHAGVTSYVDVDEATEKGAAPNVTEIDEVSLQHGYQDYNAYQAFGVLPDGRLARAPLSKVTVTPSELHADTHPGYEDASTFSFPFLPVAGEGTVSIVVATASVKKELPLVISAPPPEKR